MGTAATERVAVMAIHPRYAYAILDGEKLVEFRKRKLADDITTVLIYATAPVQQVIGEFSLKKTDVDEPAAIWAKYGRAGLIDAIDFDSYYANSGYAVALLVEKAIRYDEPHPLSALDRQSVPQSFYYVNRLKENFEHRSSIAWDTRRSSPLPKKRESTRLLVSSSRRRGGSGELVRTVRSQLKQRGAEKK
jgi:predicted transcriptional regulator